MNALKKLSLVAMSLMLFSAMTMMAVADSPDEGDTANYPSRQNDERRPDPPGRVARLQYMTGAVSIQPRGQDDWVEGSLNRPLTSTDNIWTDKNARAELNTGTGIMRMNAESSLTLTNIGDESVQVQLHQGTMNLKIRHLYNGEIYEIDTPNMAFTVQKAGEYRFDVDPDGDATMVTVWKGEGDATGNGSAVRVRAGDQARFYNGTSLAHSIHDAPRYDAFDEWSRVRDKREGDSVSGRYVSRDVIGSEDLDANGTWSETPSYGPVWRPRVEAGWAPYHYGHWIWVEPWGWTWVDDAPWGFAPFHYGRWVYYDDYWGWAPGPYYARPVYAPALVAFFGGPHFFVGASFGFGGIGWCPLGFGEPFFPFFGVSRGFFNRVNISNTRITNITNITNNYYGGHGQVVPRMRYANMNVRGGMTAVSRDTMVNARSVHNNALPLHGGEFKNVRAIDRVPFERTKNSMLGANAGKSAVAPPTRAMQRPVVSRTNPSGPTRGNQITAANGANKPMPGRGLTGTGVSTNAGRNIPRPPQRGEASNAGRNPGQNSGNTLHPQGARNGGPAGMQRGPEMTVPRPPDRGATASNRGGQNNTPRNSGAGVPRPSGPSSVRSEGQAGPRMSGGNSGRSDVGSRGVPRPTQGSVSRPSMPSETRPSVSRPSDSRPSGGRASVPRPTGRVMPAREAGSVGGSRGSSQVPRATEGSRGGQAPRSYGGQGGYSASPRSYGGQGGYSAPSRSYGNTGGGGSPRSSGGSRSAGPGGGGGGGYRSAPSGGGTSAPSHSSGGGGGHSSGGSGRQSNGQRR